MHPSRCWSVTWSNLGGRYLVSALNHSFPCLCTCAQVMNDSAKADTLLQQANDLEEASAKEFAEKSAHFIMCQRSDILDGSREDMAIVSVSQTGETMGLIESVNSVALTMFGYSKRDLLKKSVSILVPYPMSTMHDKYVQAYVETGRTVRRHLHRLTWRHASRAIFPTWKCARTLGAGVCCRFDEYRLS